MARSVGDPADTSRAPMAPEPSDQILTVPNIITTIRILSVPVFLWLLLSEKDFAAAILFAVIAATDFVDGRIARRFDQVSKLGTMLDPAADRLLILAAAIGIIIRSVGTDHPIMPMWLIIIVIVREVLTAGWALFLKARGIQLVVRFVGKVQAAMVFSSLPCFILAHAFRFPTGDVPTGAATLAGNIFLGLGYFLAIGGVTFGFITLGLYVKDGYVGLMDTRAQGREGLT